GTHHSTKLAQQLLLAPYAAFDLGHEVFRQPQVIEGLLEGLSGPLRLAAVVREALLRCAISASSGFGVFFHGSCAWGPDVLLYFVSISAGGSLSPPPCPRPPRSWQ